MFTPVAISFVSMQTKCHPTNMNGGTSQYVLIGTISTASPQPDASSVQPTDRSLFGCQDRRRRKRVYTDATVLITNQFYFPCQRNVTWKMSSNLME